MIIGEVGAKIILVVLTLNMRMADGSMIILGCNITVSIEALFLTVVQQLLSKTLKIKLMKKEAETVERI